MQNFWTFEGLSGRQVNMGTSTMFPLPCSPSPPGSVQCFNANWWKRKNPRFLFCYRPLRIQLERPFSSQFFSARYCGNKMHFGFSQVFGHFLVVYLTIDYFVIHFQVIFWLHTWLLTIDYQIGIFNSVIQETPNQDGGLFISRIILRNH